MNDLLQAPSAAVHSSRMADRLLARWWWVVVGLLAGGALGVLATSLVPRRYEGRATVLVSPSKLGAEGEVVPLDVDAYVELVRSTDSARRIVEQFQLERTDGLTPVGLLQQRLSVRRVRGTNLIEVAVRLSDPKQAAQVASAFASEAVRAVDARAAAEATGAQTEIGAQLARARARLDEVQAQLLETRRASQVELVEKDSASLLAERAKLLTIDVDIAAELGRIAALSGQLAKTPETITVARGLDRSTALLEANRAAGGGVGLGVQMTEQVLNPAYGEIQEALSLARSRLASLEESRQRMRGQLKLGADRLPRLNELYGSQSAVERLKAEYDIAVKAYAQIAEQQQLAALRVVTRTARLSLVDAALPAERPVFPSRLLFTIGGALLAAGLAAAMAMFRPTPAEA